MPAATRDEMLQVISDLHKDARGFRPRIDFSSWTTKAIENFWDGLVIELEATMKRESAFHTSSLESFSTYLQDSMNEHSIDMPTALRWDFDAYLADRGLTASEAFMSQEIESYLWDCGLSFNDMVGYNKILMDHYTQKEAA